MTGSGVVVHSSDMAHSPEDQSADEPAEIRMGVVYHGYRHGNQGRFEVSLSVYGQIYFRTNEEAERALDEYTELLAQAAGDRIVDHLRNRLERVKVAVVDFHSVARGLRTVADGQGGTALAAANNKTARAWELAARQIEEALADG